MGMVEGGVVRARRNLLIEGGVRGGAGRHSKVDAGGKLLTPFMERVDARARDSMVVDKTCLYCTVYAGSNLVVRELAYGGVINAYGSVYVGRQLGNKAAIPTQVFLGYDPVSIRQLEKLDKILKDLSQAVLHLNAVAGHLPPETNEITRKLQVQRRQYDDLLKKREQLWSRLTQDEQACRAAGCWCGHDLSGGGNFHWAYLYGSGTPCNRMCSFAWTRTILWWSPCPLPSGASAHDPRRSAPLPPLARNGKGHVL